MSVMFQDLLFIDSLTNTINYKQYCLRVFIGVYRKFQQGKKLDPKRKTDPKNERKAQSNQTEIIF